MAILTVPENYIPTGRSEDEIRENISDIPWMLLSNPKLDPVLRERIRTLWWEEILINQVDNDHTEALEINKLKNRRQITRF